MIYHVTSLKKLQAYIQHGAILPPVRAWRNIESAQRFSTQTGRKIILRLKEDDTFSHLEGHRGEALISDNIYRLEDM